MDYKYILYEKLDNIGKITVNRPGVMNVISREVYRELDDAFTEAEKDSEVRVIVVAGAGDNFGAGHDLGTKEMQAEEKENPRDQTPLGTLKDMDRGVFWYMHDRWRNIPKPTIAMVQGYCIMGSWMLASACDIIIAAEDAQFTDRLVRWGGAHDEYPTYFWDLGPRKAKEHLWTGDFIDGREACRLGMVNRAVPRERLEEETMKLARRVALNEPFALMLSKMSINQAADIMGQTAAMRASGNFWIIGKLRNIAEGIKTDVEWAKAKNKPFEEQT
ncbi:MAG: enoyl-CoA hydratase-related protein [Chloroflexota bacterium]